MELVYEVENTPLGTGGALQRAMRHCMADHVFVFNGDTYVDLEIEKIEAAWLNAPGAIIVACQVQDAARYGRLKIESGRVMAFVEKGEEGPGLINAGTYVLPATLLSNLELTTPFSFESNFLSTDVVARTYSVFVTKGNFIDIGVPEDLARAQIELAGLS